MVIVARCPECGSKYFGWALKFRVNQKCDRCGALLNTIEEDCEASTDTSHFYLDDNNPDDNPGL